MGSRTCLDLEGGNHIYSYRTGEKEENMGVVTGYILVMEILIDGCDLLSNRRKWGHTKKWKGEIRSLRNLETTYNKFKGNDLSKEKSGVLLYSSQVPVEVQKYELIMYTVFLHTSPKSSTVPE